MFSKRGGLRRAWFGGLRRDDVQNALDRLEGHNRDLEVKLAGSEQAAQQLAERMQAAEQTLATFHGTIENIGALLALAQDRAAEMEREARADAERIRAEAYEQAGEMERYIEALEERRQQVLDELSALRSSLTAVAELARPRPASVHPLPLRRPYDLPHAGTSA